MKNDRGIRWLLVSLSASALLASCAMVPDVRCEPPGPGRSPAGRTVSVLVAYHSLRGNTEKMAEAVVDGARRVEGAAVTLKKVEEVTREDLRAARNTWSSRSCCS